MFDRVAARTEAGLVVREPVCWSLTDCKRVRMMDSKSFAGTGVRLMGRNLLVVRVVADFMMGLISAIDQLEG